MTRKKKPFTKEEIEFVEIMIELYGLEAACIEIPLAKRVSEYVLRDNSKLKKGAENG